MRTAAGKPTEKSKPDCKTCALLRESEKKFRAIFDSATDGILLADVETKKFFTCNRMICKMLGYSQSEIRRLGIHDIHPKKDLPYVLKQFRAQARRKISVAKDIPVKRKDGSVFYSDINSFPLVLGGKKYLVGLFRDTTERKEAEQKLKAEKEKMESYLESMYDGVTISDFNGIFLHANSAWLKMTRYRLGEIVGKPAIATVVAKAEQPKVLKALQDMPKKGRISNLETITLAKNGKEIPVLVSCALIKDAKGKPSSVITVVKDITERKQMEEEIRAKNAELAKTNERLKELDKAKMEFLNLISHELKTPLTAAIAHLEILHDMKHSDGEQELLSLDALKRNVDQLRILINNILEISRIESGTFELNYSHINIADAINEVVDNLRILSDQKGLILRSETHGIPTIHADPDRIKTILANLIGNAIKFTDNGSVTVRGNVKNGFIEVHVIDTGMGIPDEKQLHMCEKFYQVDPAIGRRYGGTGLGLAITKQLVELHGGKISVKSKVGKGSDFWFTIPTKIPHNVAKEVKK